MLATQIGQIPYVRLSLDFTSQESGMEPNVSTTIHLSSSVAIQTEEMLIYINTYTRGGEVVGNQWA